MTIEKVANIAGLTKGYVSKLENSHRAPPFSTLIKIANALETDISLFLTDDPALLQDQDPCIVKKNERKSVRSRRTPYGYHYEALAYKKINKNMEPYIISPAFEERGSFSHEGEEFMYVLEGAQEIIYGGKKYRLDEGDCIYFNSKIRHSGRSLGKKRAKILAIMYSSKR